MSSISAVASNSVGAMPVKGSRFNPNAYEFVPAPQVTAINFDCYSSDDDGRPPRKEQLPPVKKETPEEDKVLTAEAFPALCGSKSAPPMRTSTTNNAWSKPLSAKADATETQNKKEENNEQESTSGEMPAPAKNPQEDSDQEVPAAGSMPEEQKAKEHSAPSRSDFKPSTNEAPIEPKPWRKAAAEPQSEDAPAPKLRPWSKAKTTAAEVDAGKEASRPWRKTASLMDASAAPLAAETSEEVKQRPWKPWLKPKVEEEMANNEAKQAKEEKDVKTAVSIEDTSKAKKAKESDEKIARRKAFSEKFKALKEAEDSKEKQEKEALAASSISTMSTVSSFSLRETESSEVTEEEESTSEAEAHVQQSTPAKGATLTGLPALAPGGKLTGSLTASLTGSITSLGSLRPRGPRVDQGNTLSVRSMMQWRFAAQAEQLVDRNVVYQTEMLPEEELAILFAQADVSPKKPKREDRKEKDDKDDAWGSLRREVSQPVVLESSENSWATRQKQLREEMARKNSEKVQKSEVEIVREMKSILNKLTIEKYDTLYQKMLDCGISTVEHVRILIHEVMEKATAQHHFIDMYSQFCAHLHEWFVENKVSSDPKSSFKRILLNECQNSFERYLRPIDLSGLEGEELVERQLKYKLTMLGNIKFVGALLQKKMLASSVLIAVAEELIAEPTTPEALESLATFMTSVGGTFDRDDWSYHKRFTTVFEKMEKKIKDKTVPARIRFLLQDVVDLRSTGWEDQKKVTKKQEGPSKLSDVEKKQEAEERGESVDGFKHVSR